MMRVLKRGGEPFDLPKVFGFCLVGKGSVP
jgi:hypothetical protein